MGDDIGSGLLSLAVCFDFCSTNIVQLSNRNPYFTGFNVITLAFILNDFLKEIHILVCTLCTLIKQVYVKHLIIDKRKIFQLIASLTNTAD